ncbi:sulfur carrier protein ThiS [Neobacillus mesonae]|nr:sulfur carrier protein ThiS [Neobacillus mesonae]
MKLLVNGQNMQFDESITSVSELIDSLELGIKTVVVEWNEQILTRDLHSSTRLTDGDRIEIVHFVGGG